MVEDGESHYLCSRGCCAERRERILVLPRGLADRGADDDLIDLVLTQACALKRADVHIGDHPGVVCHLLHELAERFGEAFVVEGRAANLRRRLAFPFEHSINQ